MLRATLKSRLSLVSEGNLFPRATRFDAASTSSSTTTSSSLSPSWVQCHRSSLVPVVARCWFPDRTPFRLFEELPRHTSYVISRRDFFFPRHFHLGRGPSRKEGAEERSPRVLLTEVKGASNVSDRDTRMVACVHLVDRPSDFLRQIAIYSRHFEIEKF